jgi:hypothetical protein
MFLMAATVWALARDRTWLTGGLLGLSILVRPPLAVVALVLGLALGWQRRSTRPIVSIGLPAGLGLLTLLAYNRWIFGSFSVSGGYGDFVANGAGYRTVTGYLSNLFGTFFNGTNGLFVWSPWILVALAYTLMRRNWAEGDWAIPAALAGLVYLLVHTGLNRFWGGLAFNYRYALEPLTLTLPFLASDLATIRGNALWRLAFSTTLGVSIVLQAAVAYLMTCVEQGGGSASCTIL